MFKTEFTIDRTLPNFRNSQEQSLSQKRTYQDANEAALTEWVEQYNTDLSPQLSPIKKKPKTTEDVPPLAGRASIAGSDAAAPISLSMMRDDNSYSLKIHRSGPPPAPTKSRLGRTSTTSVSPYETAYNNATKYAFLMINEITCNTIKMPNGTGTWMQAFYIDAEDPIVPSTSNDQILVKVYLPGKLTKQLDEAMKNSITNYHEAVKIGLPVSTIYNIDTAAADKFFLVEKVPYSISLKNESDQKQIRHFFEVSFQKKVGFDLSFDNLRVRENGTVALIDFTEKTPGFFSNPNKLQIFAIQFLKSWAKEARSSGMSKAEAQALLEYFSKDLPNFNPEWNQIVLDEYFREARTYTLA